jgi:glycosyltransferase involved in cell wall biosynthesis
MGWFCVCLEQSMLARIYRFISQFRMQWNSKFIFINGARCEINRSYETTQVDSVFSLESALLAGWYMLEIQIKSPILRMNGQVCLYSGKKMEYSKLFGLPLHSGRMCKRLIHLTTGRQLQIYLQLANCNFELQDFRLVRVTQKFARSRMLFKLKALHPRYKVLRVISQRSTKSVNLTSQDDLPTLWADYCALFEDSAEIVPYPRWIRDFDTLTDEKRSQMRYLIEQFVRKPLVSVVMPVYNPNQAWLETAIESVRAQIYQNWELCIADDASTDPAIRLLLASYVQLDRRIKVVFRECNGHISVASNSALTLVQGEWIAFLDHDDILAEDALFWIVDAINHHPDARLIYSDEDKIDEVGIRSDPYFKCDWNPDLFYSQNLISHLGVYFAALVREVDGFRIGLEGSQDYDLALRCIECIAPEQVHHIPRVLYHWRIHADSTAHDIDAKPYAMIAGERALNEHFERLGINANAESVGYGYRVRYSLPEGLPLVSLIIPTRNGLKLLRQCVESILEKTTYPSYEILIVDNGSDDTATLRYLQKLTTDPRIWVARDDRPFNYSALNNAAVKLVRGQIVGLINNDIEVVNPDWLSEMVSHALRPEVGAVGARLWYGDNTIQHAGIVLGMEGFAGHGHRYLPRGDVGYCGRASLIQSLSAVTGACMVVRKAIYEAVGGLNETELQVACSDVDFCLRVREAGYRNIWTPYAELYHHESATRGFDDTPEKQARAAKEVAYMQRRWGYLLQNDPAYSPNLSLENEGFTLAWPPRVASLIFDHLGSATN